MTGYDRTAMLVSACSLFLTGGAWAGAPDPGHSQWPAFINVVGTNSSATPDPAGAFTVIVHDATDAACAGAIIVIDFSACVDIRLCQDAVPGQTVDCLAKTVTATADMTGSFTFTIVGGGYNTGAVGGVAAPGCGLDGVSISANTIPLGTMTAAVLDQNGVIGGNGVNALDLSLFADDLGSAQLFGTYRARSDYDFNMKNGSLDLSSYRDYLGAAALDTGSGSGCFTGTYCP